MQGTTQRRSLGHKKVEEVREVQEVILKPQQGTAVSNLLHERNVLTVLSYRLWQKHHFKRVCTCHKRIVVYDENQYHCYFGVKEQYRRPNFRNAIAKLHSNGIFLFADLDLTTKRLLAMYVCICLSHLKLRSRLASLSTGSNS